jgi:hypothetical protein
MPVAPFGGLNWQLRQGSNRSQIHRRKIFREECDNPVVTELAALGNSLPAALSGPGSKAGSA